jgi:hypothetical protein
MMKFRLTTRPAEPRGAVQFTAARAVVTARPMRILDFDIENRPLSYLGSDFTTAEITAIAWAWVDQPDAVSCVLLGELQPVDMLTQFLAAYNQADMVTGHFITGHDLGHINGALMEYQLPTLGDKLVQDTKAHLVRRKGISGSQENLAAMLLLEHDKVKMNQIKWRAANRLTPEGLALTRERVVGDVRQHMEMRARLLELGYLAPPTVWRGGTAPVETYTP